MEERYDLKTLPVLDSMHDQRTRKIEIKEGTLIFHYGDLLHYRNKEFSSCEIYFLGVEDADIVGEVRKRSGLTVEGIRYYDLEFLNFINDHQYSIETIEFYYGYEKVIIESSLVDKNGKYCEDCVIRISASEVLYHWN